MAYKVGMLESLLAYANYYFLILNETWLDRNQIHATVLLDYELGDYFCRETTTGGGCAIWYKKGLITSTLSVAQYSVEKTLEICGLCWHFMNTDYLLISIYRPPDADFQLFLQIMDNLLHDIFDTSKPILVCGDFNINFALHSKEKRDTINLFASYGLRGIVETYTRLTSSSATLIDNVFTNFPQLLDADTFDTFLSDHRYISIKAMEPFMKAISLSPETVTKRLFNENNKASFRDHLEKETWQDMYSSGTLRDKFQIFLDTFLFYYNTCFPLTKVKIRPTAKSWVTTEVRESNNALRDLYVLQKSYPVLHNHYMQARIRHAALVNASKRVYFDNMVNSARNKTKCMWSVFRTVTNANRRHENIVLEHNDTTITDPQEIVQYFNNFFQGVPVELASSLPEADVPTDVPLVPNTMVLLPLSLTETNEIICKLRTNSAPGADGVSAGIIKDIRQLILEPLTHLINASFEDGEFPPQLQRAAVLPIFKKGDKRLVTNYRPVSLLSVFSKIFEYAMLSRLNGFIQKYNILSTRQHGFSKGKSTTTAFYDYLKFIIQKVEKRQCPLVIYCDLSKAFDCVPHNRLLNKLDHYGIRGTAGKWLTSYLGNRSQFVRLNFVNANSTNVFVSNDLPISTGVPQGSVLSPLLFNLYLNDLVTYLHDSLTIMYADDTTILLSSESLVDTIAAASVCVNSLYTWFTANGLVLNKNKTHFMIFHPRQRSIQIPDDVNVITPISSVKFLGITITETLDWADHCNELTRKIHSKCFLFRSIRSSMSLNALLNAYYAEIQSRLSYGIIFWGQSPAATMVFLAQKKLIRAIFGLKPCESCRQILIANRILTLPALYILECLCHVHKNKGNYLTGSTIHSHETRRRDDLRLPQVTMHLTSRDVDWEGIKYYNHLPPSIKSMNSVLFKKTIKKYLIEKCFYNTSEFTRVPCTL